jgi:predicted DNA-binding transcriptional regulator AlpA
MDALLTELELSEFLAVAQSTLRRWRAAGAGPKFVRIAGQRLVRYRSQDVAEFLQDRVVQPTQVHSANGNVRSEMRCLSKHHTERQRLHDQAVARARSRMHAKVQDETDQCLRELADEGDPIAQAYLEMGLI